MEVIHEDGARMVLERKGSKGLRAALGAFGLALLLVVVVVALVGGLLSRLLPSFPMPSQLDASFLALVITLLLMTVAVAFGIYRVGQADQQMVIDKALRSVKLQQVRKGEVKVEAVHDFSAIKGVKVFTNLYRHLTVSLLLDHPTGIETNIKVVSGELEATKDHRNKIALAHRLATFLGLPVIETTEGDS